MSETEPPVPMRAPALVVLVVMAACAANIVLHDDLGHGAGMDVWLAGSRDPWQFFINLDLMTGLLLALTWMLWRERRRGRAVQFGWAMVTLWWGNVVVAAYILMALKEARGSCDAFFKGTVSGAWIDRLPVSMRLLSGALALLFLAAMLVGLARADGMFLPSFGYANGFGSVAYFLGLLALRRPAKPPFPPSERTAA